jgi:hypothetical protein
MTLLDQVMEAHGGRRRWGRVREIHAHVRSGGLLMRSKFKAGKFADYGISVSTDRQSAVLEPYPRQGRSGEFAGDTVRIIDDDGSTLAERDGAREAFFGLSGVSRKLRWDDLDALYFAGYAMWNYLTTPWLLEWPGVETGEGEPIEVNGESWRRLDAGFPEGLHTHCREQSYYVDPAGLIRRHDYHPDVVFSFANAAHLCGGHREFDGLIFPTSRRVVPKGPRGRPLGGPAIVSIELDAVSAG